MKSLVIALIIVLLVSPYGKVSAHQTRVAVGVSLQIVDACKVEATSDEVLVRCRSSGTAPGASATGNSITPAQISQQWCRTDSDAMASSAPTCVTEQRAGYDQPLLVVTF